MNNPQFTGSLIAMPPTTRQPTTRRGRIITLLESMTEDQLWLWAHSSQPEDAINYLHFDPRNAAVIRTLILAHPEGDAHAIRLGLTAWLLRSYSVEPLKFMHDYARHTRPPHQQTCTCRQQRDDETRRRTIQYTQRPETT